MAITPIGIYFLYFFFSYPDSQLCGLQDRSHPTIYEQSQPFCVIYEGPDCFSPTGFCQKTMQNLRSPCTNSSVVGYIPGKCKDLAASQLCGNQEIKTKPSDEYFPSCAYIFTNRMRGRTVKTKTWPNGHSSCISEETAFYVSGKCERLDTPTVCNKNSQKIFEKNSKVFAHCAYYTGGDCAEKVCQKTVEKGRTPCWDSSVLFYVKGACKKLQASENEKEFPIAEIETRLKRHGSIIYEEIVSSSKGKAGKQELSVVSQELQATLSHLSASKINEGTLSDMSLNEQGSLNSAPETVVQSEIPENTKKISILESQIEIELLKGEIELIGSRLLTSEDQKEN